MLVQDRRIVLLKALEEAEKFSWNNDLAKHSAQACGFKEGYEEALFPHGAAELADATTDFFNEEQVQLIEKSKEFLKLRVSEKITFLILQRIELYTPYKPAIKRLSTYYSLPTRVPQATENLWKTCDMMWKLAGDSSTDFNFYTKRTLLGGVLTSTLLFWLNLEEKPENKQELEAFIARRLKEVMQLQKAKATLFTISNAAEEYIEKFAERIRR